jgi:CheY-like chemotaxis protein
MMHARMAARSSDRLSILVAEDDRELQDLYELLLADEYTVIQAYDGQEAVKLFLSNRPDLILMDIKMPIMTGREAIRRITEIDPDVPILAITAYRYDTEELGVPILRKGFSVDEFMGCVHSLLES